MKRREEKREEKRREEKGREGKGREEKRREGNGREGKGREEQEQEQEQEIQAISSRDYTEEERRAHRINSTHTETREASKRRRRTGKKQRGQQH